MIGNYCQCIVFFWAWFVFVGRGNGLGFEVTAAAAAAAAVDKDKKDSGKTITFEPTKPPTRSPTKRPSNSPEPTKPPTRFPTKRPSNSPRTLPPTKRPTTRPSTSLPTTFPPSQRPSDKLTTAPSVSVPTLAPAVRPSSSNPVTPTVRPSLSNQITLTARPSSKPIESHKTSHSPTAMKSFHPTWERDATPATNAPARVASFTFDPATMNFELSAGTELNETLVQQVVIEFMTNLIQQRYQGAGPLLFLGVDIAYVASSGVGTATINGTWKGLPQTMPPTTFLTWAVGDEASMKVLQQALKGAGIDAMVVVVSKSSDIQEPENDNPTSITGIGTKMIYLVGAILLLAPWIFVGCAVARKSRVVEINIAKNRQGTDDYEHEAKEGALANSAHEINEEDNEGGESKLSQGAMHYNPWNNHETVFTLADEGDFSASDTLEQIIAFPSSPGDGSLLLDQTLQQERVQPSARSLYDVDRLTRVIRSAEDTVQSMENEREEPKN